MSRLRLIYKSVLNDDLSPVPKPVVGRLVWARGDSLVVVGELRRDTSRVSLGSLERVDYSTGREHPRMRATALGAVGGAAMGFVYGHLRSLPCTDRTCPPASATSKRIGVAQSALFGAGIGFAAGLLAGSVISVDHWVTVNVAR